MIGDTIKNVMSNRGTAYLDTKVCFEAWVDLGTTERVCQFLADQGIRSPRSGDPPGKCSVWSAATRYAIDNPLEARAYLGKRRAESTFVATFDQL